MNRCYLTIVAIVIALTAQVSLAKSPKNILMIAIDDLNDWSGEFGGHSQTLTPNIDALAKRSVRFQKAYSASPVCNPSRTAILSGRRPHETGIDQNGDGNFRQKSPLKNVTSLPQYFTQQGYHTETIGKIFHKPGNSVGEFTVASGRLGGHSKGKIKKVANTKITWSEGDEPFEETQEAKHAQYGADFLSKKHKKPFFLAVGMFRPHLPWHAPKEFYDALPAIDKIKLPAYLKDDLKDSEFKSNGVLDEVLKQGGEKLWKETVRAYLANVSFTDAAVGNLINALNNSQYAKNTVVVLWGDHGWHLGEKNHYQKGANWERTSKTTFIIYDPSSKQSADIYHAVSLQDIFPTLVDLTGIKKPTFPVRGRSLKPLIDNPKTPWNGSALITYRGTNGIISDRYHYIDKNNGELYDLDRDPHEWTNRTKDPAYAAIKSNLKVAIQEILKGNETPFSKRAAGSKSQSPSDLRAKDIACRAVRLYWTNKLLGQGDYRIERKLKQEKSFTTIAEVFAGADSFSDIEVKAEQEYIYRIRPLSTANKISKALPEVNIKTAKCS